MEYLYHSETISNQVQELPIRITNSFPPRGLVAKVLANEPDKIPLIMHGGLVSSPVPHQHSYWNKNKIQSVDVKNPDDGFSPPPTLAEIRSLTRKTPRFYRIDSSVLRRGNEDNLPTVDKLIAKSELTGLKEVYQKVCKGNMESLKSLISRGQIYQKFAFLQTSYPSRYYEKGRPSTVAHFEITTDEEKDKANTPEQPQPVKDHSVLVPSPYFRRRQHQSARNSTMPPASPPYVYSKTKDINIVATSPIEPTIINLNNKLPELPQNQWLRERFKTKNIRGVRRRRGEGVLTVVADRSTTSAVGSAGNQLVEELPHMKNKHILYGRTVAKNEPERS